MTSQKHIWSLHGKGGYVGDIMSFNDKWCQNKGKMDERDRSHMIGVWQNLKTLILLLQRIVQVDGSIKLHGWLMTICWNIYGATHLLVLEKSDQSN